MDQINLGQQVINDYLKKFNPNGAGLDYANMPTALTDLGRGAGQGLIASNGSFNPANMPAIFEAIKAEDPTWFSQQMKRYNGSFGDTGGSTTGQGVGDTINYTFERNNDVLPAIAAIAGPFAGPAMAGGWGGAAGGLAGAAGGAFGLGETALSAAASAAASGAGAVGGGGSQFMQLADAGNIMSDVSPGYGPMAQLDGAMMPPAQVPSAAQYADWGMQQVSPGVWTQGGAAPGAWQTMMNGGSALTPGNGEFGSTKPGDAVYDVNGNPIDTGGVYNPTFMDGLKSMLGIGGSELSAAAAVKSLLGGGSGGSGSSILDILGRAAPGLIGAYASSKATDAYKEMADKFAGYGAPYRQRLSDIYADPSRFLNSPEVQKPVQMGSDIMARSLSVQGNPTGSGNALQQLQSYSADQLFGRLGQEKDRLSGFGGLSAYNAAAPSAAASVIGSSNNTANALGAAANNVFTPPKTLAEQLQAFKTLSG